MTGNNCPENPGLLGFTMEELIHPSQPPAMLVMFFSNNLTTNLIADFSGGSEEFYTWLERVGSVQKIWCPWC